MNSYDVIVVGAGNSGLISALTLLNDGYKVLLLDEHNNIGGFSREIRKGRFNFDLTFNKLYLKNNNSEPYMLRSLFKKLNIDKKIDFAQVSELCHFITPDKNVVLPLGVENYIEKIEELVPGSRSKLEEFFELARECREALNYVVTHKDNIDYDYIKEEYNNFMRVAGYSLSKVLDAIDVPLEAQEILDVLWIYWGSSEIEISFVSYAVSLLNMLEYGLEVPSNNGYDISLTIANEFLEKGGELKLNSKVVKLLVEDGQVNGVKLLDGNIYYANKVIVNSNMWNVYGSLIEPSEIPREALKNMNKRELGGRLFTVNLALNRSASELGLNDYTYIIYHSLDSDLEFNRMKEIANGNQISFVYNNANSSVSPAGTCLISLNTIFFDDCYTNYVTEDSLFGDDREIAQRLIQVFQKYTKVKIADYIEEIEIVSPITNFTINDIQSGSTYGYRLSGLDNYIPRLLNYKNERYIDGLYLCGGFDGDIFGYNSSFISGYEVAMDVLKEIKGDK